MSLHIGDTIEGKYRIVRLLGEGGMGAVYEGENTRIHRKVAIKVLHAAVAAKADVVQRFEREAQAAGRIGSEHIVEVLDLGNLPDGDRFMVMEFLEGESLGERIKRKKRLEPLETARVLHQLLEGLGAAHAAGIIHRDLKPDNVFLVGSKGGRADFVKIVDFGVSKFSALDNEMSMTRTGAVMGTPYYMSPEQARGGKIDFRSDLYAVGVIMYQAVTGRVPFLAETFNELVFKIALESPDPPEVVAPGLDPAFAAIILRAMTRDAAGRFQTAAEFQAAIAQWMLTSSPDAAVGLGLSAVGAAAPAAAPVLPAAPAAGALGAGSGLGQSGLGAQGLGQSGPQGLGQSGPQGLGQSGPQLGASQGGLAMTSPRPRSSGVVIAVAVVVTLLFVGGGFGAYRAMAAKDPPAPSASPAATSPAKAASAAPTTDPSSAVASAAPTAAPSTAPTAAPVAAAAAAPATTAVNAPVNAPVNTPANVPTGGKTAGTGGRTGGKAGATAKADAPAAPTSAPVKTGRQIGSEL